MRTNHLFGVPLMLGGLSLLVVGIAFSLSLLPPLPADAQVVGVQIGAAQVPVAVALLVEVILIVVGVEVTILGVIVAVFGAGRERRKRLDRAKTRR